jgi:hypothetical protein
MHVDQRLGTTSALIMRWLSAVVAILCQSTCRSTEESWGPRWPEAPTCVYTTSSDVTERLEGEGKYRWVWDTLRGRLQPFALPGNSHSSGITLDSTRYQRSMLHPFIQAGSQEL